MNPDFYKTVSPEYAAAYGTKPGQTVASAAQMQELIALMKAPTTMRIEDDGRNGLARITKRQTASLGRQ